MTQYKINCLDHGSVILRNLAGPTRRAMNGEPLCMGDLPDMARPFDADDVDPAQAARMSFKQMGSERTYEADMKLAKYLLVNEHSSPFEMIQIWLEVTVPIFIDRQFVRHRMWRRNESSARYIVLPDKWYIPETVGGKPVGGAKQGQSDTLDIDTQEFFKEALQRESASGYAYYLEAIERGVAPEEARLFLHLNHYVHWLGNVDLGNMYKFLALREHSHAQKQARVYAVAIIELLRPHIPGLMGLFDEVVKKHD